MVAFAPGAVLTAANLNTAFNSLTFRAVTGTSDTLVLADNGGAVSYSNAAATTSTIPPNSSVAFATGTVIQLLNLGAGVVTVTAGVGVTLNGSVVTLAQNAGGLLIKTAINTWYFLPSGSSLTSAVATVDTTQTTTSTGYTDLATAGPAVTLTTGTKALIIVASHSYNQSSGQAAYMGYAISGATTLAATDLTAWFVRSSGVSQPEIRASAGQIVTGLTAGSNTFTAKFRVDGGTGNYRNRAITVVDMGS